MMTSDKIKALLFNREFKPNCGWVMVDFFIRHGLIDDPEEVKEITDKLTLNGSLAGLPVTDLP